MQGDLSALWVSIQLASVASLILLVLGTPLAWWLSISSSRLRNIVEACVALPLILPPTVLGFYLLLAFSPSSFLGSTWFNITGHPLVFSFSGLVIGSVIYSLPFVVQPLHSGFRQVNVQLLEAAATLGASPAGRFIHVILPICRSSVIIATSLGFAHTLGEFGVVLMLGGNISGETRVLSVAIYEHVETLNYAQAHRIAAGLLIFSFTLLIFIYGLNRNSRPTLHL